LAGVTAQVGDVVPVGQTIASAGPSGTAAAAPTRGGSGRISPKARKIAQEHGIDLSTLQGSGPGGEILADDVLKAAQSRGAGAAPAAAAATAVAAGPAVDAAAQMRLTTAARLMAERTTQSWTTVPHFFLTREIDATAVNAAREKALPAVQQSHGLKVTHTDLLVSAVARALARHPRMNASWVNGGLQANPDVHVALAVAVEGAVVTAVIRNADKASLGDIAKRRQEIGERARANKLQPADISGATFTISNLGMFGIDAFTAIIVPPQAGILAVGAITDRVAAVNGMLGVRPMMTMTLSSDHRVIDGAGAAQFLGDVVKELQQL
jgi:pyruvate dehydrogenase E2 component (dihydrolipoamide acetyltransferase)